MMRVPKTIVILLSILGVLLVSTNCRFNESSVDVTDAEELSPLVGLCLVTETEMALVPFNDEPGYFLGPTSGAQHLRPGEDYVFGDRGSVVHICEIELTKSFDATDLLFWGQLETPEGQEYSRVLVNWLLRFEWRTKANEAVKRRATINLDTEDLPLVWDYVRLCPTQGNGAAFPTPDASSL